MAPQPGIIEAFLAQLAGQNNSAETAVAPMYGTDREVRKTIILIRSIQFRCFEKMIIIMICHMQSLLQAVADLKGRLSWGVESLSQCSSRGQVIFTWASGWTLFTVLWLSIEVIWTLLPPRWRTSLCPTLWQVLLLNFFANKKSLFRASCFSGLLTAWYIVNINITM